MPRSKKETNIEIPGRWVARDRHLHRLAQETGFRTINKLLDFVAWEVAHVKSPAVFYRAMANFYEMARKRKARR